MSSLTQSSLLAVPTSTTDAPARPRTIHPLHRYSSLPAAPPMRPVTTYPLLGRSSLPPRITILPGRISRPPPRPTLPPGVRASRMMVTVRKVAARLARTLPRHVDVEELVGAGSLGLADAFSRRGGMPGLEFEAFAAYRIRGAMLDELRRLDAMSRCSRKSAKRVALARRTVEQRLGRPGVGEEIATELGLENDEYEALRGKIDARRAPIPLGLLGSEEDDAEADVVDPKDEAPDALASRAQISQLIAANVGALPERMRVVLRGIYVEETTLKEIGRSLGVSESRACQIHTEALALLRSMFSEREQEEEREEANVSPRPPPAPASVSRLRTKPRAKAQGAAA